MGERDRDVHELRRPAGEDEACRAHPRPPAWWRPSRDHATATTVTAFTGVATVVDDGHTYEGAAAIEGRLGRAAAEFTFTVRLTGARQTDADHFIVARHLEGDFPGGTVDPRCRFTLREGLVERLVIEP
ncbi:nuclear transport factor 2 family protein [Streptomyces sp. NPDC050988]|uniref:nuclear transport factor 2 family protein n=1 Tax=Streptomyces sp. NPDC050988 TaxID=3365637 RepID=UPI0037A738FF